MKNQMEAVFLEDVNKLVFKIVDIPEISDDDILIKVDSCSICGSDIRIISNGYTRVKYPAIMGHEIAGRVVKVGKNQEHKFKIGNRICLGADIPCGTCEWCKIGLSNNCSNTIAFGHEYQGGFAEYLKIDKRSINFGPVFSLPENDLSQDEFALSEPLACCINGLELCNMSLSKTIIIFGGGPIGILLAKLSRLMGSSYIVLCDVDEEKLEKAKISNADDYVISSKSELDLLLKNKTNNNGFDIVITACPSLKAQELAFNYVKRRGVINFFGGLPQNEKNNLSIISNLIHYKELTVLGSHGSTPRQHRIAVELILNKRIYVKDIISKSFALKDIHKAVEEAKSGKNLKIVINP